MPDISTYFTPENHIFISGVGGVSTSALASLLRLRGITVSGSDALESATTERLRSEGVTVHIGHSASSIDGATCLIRSAAIHDDNPEITAARAAGIPVYERADAWGAIMTEHRHAICIAGTHGKTTTTGFAAQIALAAGLDPTITVGGNLPGVGTHRVGSSEIIIAESCEYCNSFLRFRPTTAVVLNIEEDHLDFFSGIEEIKDSFEKFCRLVPPSGRIVLNLDDPNTREVMSRLTAPTRAAAGAQSAPATAGAADTATPPQHSNAPQHTATAPTPAAPAGSLAQGASRGAPIITFSTTDPTADVHAANITHTRGRYSFDLVLGGNTSAAHHINLKVVGKHNVVDASDTSPGLPSGGKDADNGIFSGRSVAVNPASRIDHGLDSASSPRISVPVTLSVVGAHNVTDALAAAASLLGVVPPETIAAALSNARGVARRFEYKGEFGGADVYDDYAHHPSEIEALFAAARAALGDTGGRLLAIFHPHTYSRTKSLRAEFADALAKADAACILPIYAAREDPDPEISSEMLAADINALIQQRPGCGAQDSGSLHLPQAARATASASASGGRVGTARSSLAPAPPEGTASAEAGASTSAAQDSASLDPPPAPFCSVADTFESAAAWARTHVSPGDILLTVGAGEAYKVADLLFIYLTSSGE